MRTMKKKHLMAVLIGAMGLLSLPSAYAENLDVKQVCFHHRQVLADRPSRLKESIKLGSEPQKESKWGYYGLGFISSDRDPNCRALEDKFYQLIAVGYLACEAGVELSNAKLPFDRVGKEYKNFLDSQCGGTNADSGCGQSTASVPACENGGLKQLFSDAAAILQSEPELMNYLLGSADPNSPKQSPKQVAEMVGKKYESLIRESMDLKYSGCYGTSGNFNETSQHVMEQIGVAQRELLKVFLAASSAGSAKPAQAEKPAQADGPKAPPVAQVPAAPQAEGAKEPAAPQAPVMKVAPPVASGKTGTAGPASDTPKSAPETKADVNGSDSRFTVLGREVDMNPQGTQKLELNGMAPYDNPRYDPTITRKDEPKEETEKKDAITTPPSVAPTPAKPGEPIIIKSPELNAADVKVVAKSRMENRDFRNGANKAIEAYNQGLNDARKSGDTQGVKKALADLDAMSEKADGNVKSAEEACQKLQVSGENEKICGRSDSMLAEAKGYAEWVNSLKMRAHEDAERYGVTLDRQPGSGGAVVLPPAPPASEETPEEGDEETAPVPPPAGNGPPAAPKAAEAPDAPAAPKAPEVAKPVETKPEQNADAAKVLDELSKRNSRKQQPAPEQSKPQAKADVAEPVLKGPKVDLPQVVAPKADEPMVEAPAKKPAKASRTKRIVINSSVKQENVPSFYRGEVPSGEPGKQYYVSHDRDSHTYRVGVSRRDGSGSDVQITEQEFNSVVSGQPSKNNPTKVDAEKLRKLIESKIVKSLR